MSYYKKRVISDTSFAAYDKPGDDPCRSISAGVMVPSGLASKPLYCTGLPAPPPNPLKSDARK